MRRNWLDLQMKTRYGISSWAYTLILWDVFTMCLAIEILGERSDGSDRVAPWGTCLVDLQ